MTPTESVGVIAVGVQRKRGDTGESIEAIHYDDLVADREHGDVARR